MKEKKALLLCLALQLFAFGFAIFAFSYFEDRKVAGQWTGPFFLASGAVPLVFAILRNLKWKDPSVICSLLMTFVFSIPMLLTRYTSMGSNFSELTVLGIPSVQFHRFSGMMFCILIVAELYQLYRLRKQG